MTDPRWTALVVLAPLLAALAPSALPAGSVRRALRIALAVVAALLPLSAASGLDTLGLAFLVLVSVLGALAVTFSTGHGIFVGVRGDRVGDPDDAPGWSRVSAYFGLLGAFWSAMLLVVLAQSFTLLWLGISATTLATALLVAFAGESASLEAAWKYLILCSVGIAFALLGMLVLAHVALAAGVPPPSALSWSAIAANGSAEGGPLARLGIGLMLVGFATKAGLVPLHAWLPDAHSKAPAPVSGLLSGVLVSCALYALFRTVGVAEALGCGPFARTVLTWLGAASIVVAGTLMLVQTDLKRLLAYSTVEHAGLVALALGFGPPLGELAALVHVLAHGPSKAAAFFAVGLVQRDVGTTTIADLHGLWRRGSDGRRLVAAFAALAGMPPFGVFVGELLVIAAGVAARGWLALGVALLGLALAFTALSRTAIAVAAGPPSARARAAGAPGLRYASGTATLLALAAALAVVLVPWLGAAR